MQWSAILGFGFSIGPKPISGFGSALVCTHTLEYIFETWGSDWFSLLNKREQTWAYRIEENYADLAK